MRLRHIRLGDLPLDDGVIDRIVQVILLGLRQSQIVCHRRVNRATRVSVRIMRNPLLVRLPRVTSAWSSAVRNASGTGVMPTGLGIVSRLSSYSSTFGMPLRLARPPYSTIGIASVELSAVAAGFCSQRGRYRLCKTLTVLVLFKTQDDPDALRIP